MDPYSFGIALASSVLAALTLLLEHRRRKSERETAERHRNEDRGEKSRDRRLDVFLAFLQHANGVRDSVMRAWFLQSKLTKENERFALQEVEQALDAVLVEQQALQRCANTIAILEPDLTGKASALIYETLVEGVNRMGNKTWQRETEVDEWNIAVQRLSGDFCALLNAALQPGGAARPESEPAPRRLPRLALALRWPFLAMARVIERTAIALSRRDAA